MYIILELCSITFERQLFNSFIYGKFKNLSVMWSWTEVSSLTSRLRPTFALGQWLEVMQAAAYTKSCRASVWNKEKHVLFKSDLIFAIHKESDSVRKVQSISWYCTPLSMIRSLWLHTRTALRFRMIQCCLGRIRHLLPFLQLNLFKKSKMRKFVSHENVFVSPTRCFPKS